jgi:hypothetical protein
MYDDKAHVSLKSTLEYKAPAYAATVFAFVFIACFALGWLGVTRLYPAEVTPIRVRAEVNGLSASFNWLVRAPLLTNHIPITSQRYASALSHPLTTTLVLIV